MRTIRAVLDRIDSLTIPLARGLAVYPHPPTYRDAVVDCCGCKGREPPLPQLRAMQPSFDIAGEERFLQDIVDEVLAQSVWITGARRMRGQELIESRRSVRLAVTAALSGKVCERAAGVIKAAFTKMLTKRKLSELATPLRYIQSISCTQSRRVPTSVMHTCS